ncbi:leucine-rich repeat domain-containing protein [Leptospira borgpetersenii]|uniref:leucine-rich repeat domain-containing protein n=1 Tax=Leptospira borgpetersenii TaxID=174 RepID=UPI000773C2AB
MNSNPPRINLQRISIGVIGFLFFLLGSSVFAKTRAKVYNDLWEALEDSRNVTSLYLGYNNKFVNLPNKIGQLKNLQELDLSGNELTCLPNEIGAT